MRSSFAQSEEGDLEQTCADGKALVARRPFEITGHAPVIEATPFVVPANLEHEIRMQEHQQESIDEEDGLAKT